MFCKYLVTDSIVSFPRTSQTDSTVNNVKIATLSKDYYGGCHRKLTNTKFQLDSANNL